MLPRLEYFDTEVDDEETQMLRDERSEGAVEPSWVEDFDSDEDPLVDTQLMPAKHGARSPMVASHDRLRVPSPYPSAPKQYASGVQKKVVHAEVTPPPPTKSDPPELPSLFAELYSSVDPTGSDVYAPIHRLDGSAPMPSSAALAGRRSPWAIQVTPPEFDPIAVPIVAPHATSVAQAESGAAPVAAIAREKKSRRGSAIVGGLLGIACGFLIVSIANGKITSKDARAAMARGAAVVDAVLSYH